MFSRLTLLVLGLALLPIPTFADTKTFFREDFRDDVEARIPVTNNDLTSDFLTLQRLGPGADLLKLSYHPNIANDPHYVWNGECQGPALLAFQFKTTLDLSSPDIHLQIGSKNVGKSKLHLAFQVGEKWFVRTEPLANKNEWNTQHLRLLNSTWRTLDPETITIGKEKQNPDFRKTTAIGFVSPIKPNSSKDCTRLNWFELSQGPFPKTIPLATPLPDPSVQTKPLPPTGFIEPETPFLRSALVFQHEGQEHFVRRGVLVPLHFKNRWACFDPDTLRWVVVWEAPAGQQPITMDSMAAVSFPDAKAKAKQVPRPVGEILLTFPTDPYCEPFREERTAKLTNLDRPAGPAPSERGQWLGLGLSRKKVVLNFSYPANSLYEMVSSDAETLFRRTSHLTPNKGRSSAFENLTVSFYTDGRIEAGQTKPLAVVPPSPIFAKSYQVQNQEAQQDGPFTIRNLNFPKLNRPIRATDVAFRKNGDGYLVTLDGDVWRIQDCEKASSTWTRVATGIFEPMAIEVDAQDRLFVLGRDQITELMDLNGDGHIDKYRNASDIFQQTLHTRDYATSLAIGKDGSYYIAKGGIFNGKEKGIENELSEHRGTVIRISSDGEKAEVLADGLRLPYVGLRNDGTVFASDQQGNHVPSTPLHLISNSQPFLGFEPTNFRKSKTVTEPLLWYPYQANRSGAAFCTTSAKAFPDLPETFSQVSWNGRLFAIETPETGQPFSWKLPLQLDFPALNGAVHPQSGRLYVTGLGISGYKPTTPDLVGLASIEQGQPFPAPVALEVSKNTIRVTFNRALTANESITPGNPLLRLFNVKRTPKYGSGHYLWNDKPGEHTFAAKTFQLSPDRKSFTASFDSLHRSDLFDLQLIVSSDKQTFPLHLYTRPAHLSPASKRDLQKLAEAEKNKPKLLPGQAKLGEPLFTQYACIGCHSLEGHKLVGPALNGIAGRLNRAKLRESILEPAAEVAKGFEPAMPSFAGVIPPQDLEHLLSYLATLK